MAIANDLSNVKDIGLYGYCDDRKGNIEINFRIDKIGNYKLTISEKDLKTMNRFSKLGKML